MTKFKIIIFLISIFFINAINASFGDTDHYFEVCLKLCHNKTKCSLAKKFEKKLSTYLKLFGRSCFDECKYECMWPTVYFYIDVWKFIHKFYGKWPFTRIFGIQEPLSTLTSIGNLLVHAYLINKMRKRTKKTTPFINIWYIFGFISINAWFWSTVFHANDTYFTEKMDYYSAFSLVMFQFYAFFFRLLRLKKHFLIQLTLYIISIYCVYFYCSHIYYLNFINFDYNYNLKVNIVLGVTNSICWLVWSFYQYYFLNKKYVWRCVLSLVLVNLALPLEVLEFAPIWWTIDTHAIWHLCTICIPFYWYEFIFDDNNRIDLEYGYSRIRNQNI